MSLQEIVSISREYGSDERYVLAGGGNTSFKDKESLYIKASGFALSTIGEDGFVRMERHKLDEIWTKQYPAESAEREKVALADLMAARAPGEGEKRPSVETLLHEAIPDAFVVHTHPSLVNGLTCSEGGEGAALALLGDSVLWIPLVNAGYILAATVRDALQKHQAKTGSPPEYILLQNHGVFISGDEIDTIKRRYDVLFSFLEAALIRKPDTTAAHVNEDRVNSVTKLLTETYGGWVRFISNAGILSTVENHESFEPVSSAYTPDQIVYCGHRALYVDSGIEGLSAALSKYEAAENTPAKIVALPGLGVFGCGTTEKAADNAALLFGDTVKIGVYTESFGGYHFMPKDQIDFIRGWEVEHYRSKLAEK